MSTEAWGYEGGATGSVGGTRSLARHPEDEEHPLADRDISLVDLLDRVLSTGVVIAGDLTISIADVDLVRVSLHALVSSINEDVRSPWEHGHPVRGMAQGPGVTTSVGERPWEGSST